MIHQQDEELLLRWCGGEIPNDVSDEYEVRLRMYHSAGAGGALGPIGLIDMLRGMKLGPELKRAAPAPVDWRGVPGGAAVVVRQEIPGQDDNWITGTFHGFSSHGMLKIEVEGDAWVREYRKADVRIAQPDDLVQPSKPPEPEPAIEDTAEFKSLGSIARVLVDQDGDLKDAVKIEDRGDSVVVMIDGKEDPEEVPLDSIRPLE